MKLNYSRTWLKMRSGSILNGGSFGGDFKRRKRERSGGFLTNEGEEGVAAALLCSALLVAAL